MRWLKLDALNRAWRTLLQGVLMVVIVPAVDAGIQVVQREALGMWAGQGFDLHRLGIAAGTAATTAAGMAITAYLHRLKLDPSSIPSAQPPLPPEVHPSAAPATKVPDFLQ